jgi:hypothetical protein
MLATLPANPATLFTSGLRLLRDHPEERGRIHKAIHGWYRAFNSLTAVDAFAFNASPDIVLPSGTALGSAAAAFCLLEAQRTAVFLRGVESAVRALQMRFPGERIRILYAGCGPFASLLTPLTARLMPHEVGWHLLEINPGSLAAVQRLHEELGLEPYLLGMELADASRYVMPREPGFHLVLTETMQRALQNETQLAISLNLLPQLQPGALFLPQRLAIHACVGRWDSSTEPSHPVFQHLDTLYEIGQASQAAPQTFALRVPALASPGHLQLTTEVQVYEDEMLRGNDTSITLPQDMHRLLHGGEQLVFHYRWMPRPGFVCEQA